MQQLSLKRTFVAAAMSAGVVVLIASAALAATSIGTDVTTDGVLSTTGNATLGSDAADLLTLNGTLQGASPLVFEGATADAFETMLAITDPTADRTITIPDLAGALVLDTAVQTLTNKTLTSPKIGTGILDTNGNSLLALTATGSAVNFLQLTNQATGSGPYLDATGTDASVAMNFRVKGSAGSWNFLSTVANSDQFLLALTPGSAATFGGTLNIADLTAGRSWTMPDASGNIVLDAATQTLTNKTLTSPRLGTSILDANGNVLLGLAAVPSSVNSVTLSNNATGGNPFLSLSGADASVGLGILLKADGPLNVASSTANSDSISLAPNTTGGTSNMGTITTEDLNTAKTWTFPNLTGTVALTANNLSGFAATTSAQLAGVISDETGSGALVLGTGPTLAGATITTSALALSGLDPDITTGTNEDLALSPNGTGRIKMNKPVRDLVQAGTANDSGNASPGDFGSINPATSYLELTCNDADGCTIALDEAAPVAQGQSIVIVNVGTNATTLADVAGVTELSTASFVMGQFDSITLRYTSDRWVETARSNN